MQRVLSWGKSIPEYQAEFSNMRKEPPCRCLECGCTKLHKWGTYKRYVVDKDGDHQIPVQRYRCVKCGRSYSCLPSFCVSRRYCSVDLVMKLLGALLLKIKFALGEMKRQAYIYLKRFVRLESLWLVFLRGWGFGDFPRDKRERTVKIFTALLKQYKEKDFSANFLTETGRHFMAAK